MNTGRILKSAVVCAFALLCGIGAKAQTKTPQLLDPSAFETEIGGKKVSLYTITNGTITVQVTNYAGYIVGIFAPDKDGNYDNVVGHNDNIQQYMGFSMNPCGAALGRYANRIANAEFSIDGVTYHVTKNNGEHMLHGGAKGFDHSVFDVVSVTENAVVMSIDLADGLDGFPGNLKTILTFSVTPDNGVMIDYKAATDKPTVCSLSHHAYFNLNGFADPQFLTHKLWINADNITESDPGLIPTGKLLPVDGTPYDFRQETTIGDRQVPRPAMPANFMGFGAFPDRQMPRPNGQPGGQPGGQPAGQPQPQARPAQEPVPDGMVRSYDQNFCLNHSAPGALELVASLYAPESGRLMEVINNHPGMQLFTGNRSAIAMESQMFPDSPNHPEFQSTVLRPGEIYSHTVIYRFSVR
uniref:Aldose 1-epimerase n=1 Tax=uncultured bacterium fosmid pJB89E1 TaxID=1478073 RepID=A0A0H3UA06_9BACT|nr:hypothetical protein [uncultured bacterium fosmid pJB89E1]